MKSLYIKGLSGMKVFTLIWFGQLLSIMGTAMSGFALMIWAYEQVGKASTVAFLGFSSILPYVLISPIAGVVVDRFEKKKIMILSDLGAGIVTLVILFLYNTASLQVWHLYLARAISGVFEAFQLPAFSTMITLLIPKDQYTRASGMRSFANWSSTVFAPIFAGALMLVIGIKGILIIDTITFLFAITTLLIVKITISIDSEVTKEKFNNIWDDILFGIHYILKRKGLFWLMNIFVLINFLASATYYGILPAMVLARTNNNRMILASLQSALGIGGVVGSLFVSFRGVPRKKVLTIFIAAGASFLLGDIFLAIDTSVYIWYAAAFLSSFFIPFIMGAESAIWQSKVEPRVQGRVFSMKEMMKMGFMPLGYLFGGLLADYFFEPAMKIGGCMNETFSWIVGSGNGAGMALMFLINGILGFLLCVSSLLNKNVRNLEIDLPDH